MGGVPRCSRRGAGAWPPPAGHARRDRPSDLPPGGGTRPFPLGSSSRFVAYASTFSPATARRRFEPAPRRCTFPRAPAAKVPIGRKARAGDRAADRAERKSRWCGSPTRCPHRPRLLGHDLFLGVPDRMLRLQQPQLVLGLGKHQPHQLAKTGVEGSRRHSSPRQRGTRRGRCSRGVSGPAPSVAAARPAAGPGCHKNTAPASASGLRRSPSPTRRLARSDRAASATRRSGSGSPRRCGGGSSCRRRRAELGHQHRPAALGEEQHGKTGADQRLVFAGAGAGPVAGKRILGLDQGLRPLAIPIGPPLGSGGGAGKERNRRAVSRPARSRP